MPKQKKKPKGLLVVFTLLMGLGMGAAITQSSATPSPIEKSSYPELISPDNSVSSSMVVQDHPAQNEVSDSVNSQVIISESLVPGESSAPLQEELASEGQSVTPGVESADSEELSSSSAGIVPAADSYAASPEAERGVWTIAEGKWYLFVDGSSYHGWFFDTDRHIYYFQPETGIMTTGLAEIDGKRYYFDEDGILQTKDVSLYDGTIYHINADGTVASEENTAAVSSAALNPAETSGSSVKAEPGSAGSVALTFDDGPGSYTDRLLDCLEKYQAKATFFMVGQEAEYFPETVKRMEALGCELGNHSYDHTNFAKLNAEQISSEIGRVDQLLLDLVGHGATVVRPPYGEITDTVRSTVGTPMILWSIDTLDWETKNVASTLDIALTQVKDGDIILMHDIYETSVEAAEELIPALLDRGFLLLTVHELAAAHGEELRTGIAYGSFN